MKKAAILFGTVGLAASLFLNGVDAKIGSPHATENPKQKTKRYSIGQCRFEIAEIFGGYLIEYPDASRPRGTYYVPTIGTPRASSLADGFALECRSASAEQLSTALNAKYVSGRWWRFGPDDGPELVPFDRKAHIQTIALKGTNWTSMAYTADDTTGEKRIRARRFHFCLIHDTRALCGGTPVMWMENSKVNDLWMVKAILESIRFDDTPPETTRVNR